MIGMNGRVCEEKCSGLNWEGEGDFKFFSLRYLVFLFVALMFVGSAMAGGVGV